MDANDDKKVDPSDDKKVPIDFEAFKAHIVGNKAQFSSVSGHAELFKSNLKKLTHFKHPKSENHESFWSKVIEKIKFEDETEDDAKEMASLIEKFEKGDHKSFDDMNDKLSAFLEAASDKILDNFLDAFMSESDNHQDLDIEFEHFWNSMRAIPTLHHILPPLPKDTGYDFNNWSNSIILKSSSSSPKNESFDLSVISISRSRPKNEFCNWAENVCTFPEKMIEIKSIDDITNLITKAKEDPDNIKKVRVSVFRHSFSPLFSDDKQLHGLLLPRDMTTLQVGQPDLEFNEEKDATEVHVKGLPETTGVEILQDNKIRVKCGTSNNDYIRLAGRRISNKLLYPAEPANSLQFFQGFCGTHAIACHGGGINTTTLCDYITKLKMINHEGKEVTYEGDILKKMSAHFGLLGIVTEMEIQYDPPYLASFQPKRRTVDKYFPRKGKCEEFQNDVMNNYYNEFFWFPFSESTFINVWKRQSYTPGDEYTRYPDKKTQKRQKMSESMFQTAVNLFYPPNGLKGKAARGVAKFVSKLGDKALKAEKKAIICPSFDALHFRRGIQCMRVLDMEWIFPLDELKDDDGNLVYVDFEGKKVTVPDVSLCRDLWRGCMDLVDKYDKEKKEYPQVLPLEMRIIRGSDVCLSAAHGAKFVVYIEVLTVAAKEGANKLFYKYCQDLTDVWADLAGTKYMRPHWGKLWQNFTVKGKSIYEHLREAYADDLKVFNEIRKEADPNNMFLNDALAKIFLDPKESKLKTWMQKNDVWEMALYDTLIANDIDDPDKLKDVKQDKFDAIVRQVRVDRYSQLKDQNARDQADKLLVKFEKEWRKLS